MKKACFVFGSNLAGRHGKGAALHAKKYYGARHGVGEGPTGNSYAIPTKDNNLNVRSEHDIAESIKKFILYATQNSDTQFELTPIGCGLAGFKAQDVMKFILTLNVPENVLFSRTWFTDHNLD